MTDEVFDLDALAAESEGEPFRFRFGGEDYTMPPLDMKLALQEMTSVEMFQAVLGEEQWGRIVASDARLTEPMFTELLDRWTKHYGTTLGESKASSSPSRSTAGRSKRTSNASMALR